ncbi:MAG TPA: ferrous iron transport protein A [Verrucomicrobia bacterium]|nr:ferrous iron transport protein A [Verrucomicrobiota bacterium]
MRIRDMEVGQSARIVRFGEGDRHYRQKLIQMGMTRGVVFSLIRKAPLGDPLEVNCGGMLLSLRKGESDGVEVEVCQV